MGTRVNDNHVAIFAELIAPDNGDTYALVNTTFDGVPTAAIVRYEKVDGGLHGLAPIAVLVQGTEESNRLFARLTEPVEREGENLSEADGEIVLSRRFREQVGDPEDQFKRILAGLLAGGGPGRPIDGEPF